MTGGRKSFPGNDSNKAGTKMKFVKYEITEH